MKITKAQLAQFLNQYNVGALLNFQKIELGLMNKILLIETDSGKYILKILIQNNSGNKLNYELDLLNFLKDLPTPRPIIRKDLKYWSFFGKNKAFLMEYMPGEHKKVITNNDLKSIGVFLGKMHNQTARFRSSIKRLETLSHSSTSLNKIYRTCSNIKDTKTSNALKYIQGNINTYLPPKELPIGAIHSDFKQENCLFKKNILSGVVDFDNSYIAPLIIDLANTIIWFCAKGSELDTKKTITIIEAYQTARKMSKNEKAYLLKAIHFTYLRNLLRGIEYFAMKKVKKDLIDWAIDNFLVAEQKLPAKLNI